MARQPNSHVRLPFLAIPPFPGRRVSAFERLPDEADAPASLAKCVAVLRDKKVGGSYWARQPDLPPGHVLIRSATDLDHMPAIGEVVFWNAEPIRAEGAVAIWGECDPWHMLAGATAVVCDADDEIRHIAAILSVPVYITQPGRAPLLWNGDMESLLADSLPINARFANPFGGRALDLLEAIELCGFWRKLIDANRSIQCGVGFAFWKQATVLPLLWGGGDSTDFFKSRSPKDHDGAVAVWRSKSPGALIKQLEDKGTPLVEVEDGFLRSRGLGADCVPPLSITVDRLGAHFDPASPSELEELLQHGPFDGGLLERAARLRETIVAAGLGKYESGEEPLERPGGEKRHILVAGQVEDDRSILAGGAGLSNLDLLRRVRSEAPDAYIVYKPHPDVVTGHRVGHIDQRIGRQFADKIVSDASISSLIGMVDEVHVNTSLAGFEALMRHKSVTTYGVPFYAGWGLTRDLGPVPSRRRAKRSLDELVAATLLLYPRYLDPVSGLPAPAEVIVDRLVAPVHKGAGTLVALRRIQGRLKRMMMHGGAR